MRGDMYVMDLRGTIETDVAHYAIGAKSRRCSGTAYCICPFPPLPLPHDPDEDGSALTNSKSNNNASSVQRTQIGILTIQNNAPVRVQTLSRNKATILASEEDEASRYLAGLSRATHRRAAELLDRGCVHGCWN